MVQNIHRVQPDFKLLRFSDLHSLEQIHVQADLAGSLDPILTQVAYLARRRIHQEKPALSIRYSELAARCLEVLRSRDTDLPGSATR